MKIYHVTTKSFEPFYKFDAFIQKEWHVTRMKKYGGIYIDQEEINIQIDSTMLVHKTRWDKLKEYIKNKW